MPYVAFHQHFPELAQETRTITVKSNGHLGIPPGHYHFLEMYCNEPGCDCRRVLFHVFSSASKKVEAVIGWGWESVDYYEKWLGCGDRELAERMKGPGYRSGSDMDTSDALLQLAGLYLLNDPAYVQRLRTH